MASTGHHGAVVGDGEASTDAGGVIDVLGLASANADLLDDLLHERRYQDGEFAAEVQASLLLHDVDADRAVQWIVSLDEAAHAVLQLRNDLTAAVVRRGVGGEQNQHVDVKLHRV